jgi:hypothetical protein
MIPIKKLGFKTLKELGTQNLTQEMSDFCLCIRNAFSLENQDIWYRETSHAFEFSVVLSFTRDKKIFESLIRVDNLLKDFRALDFAIGEIKPAEANYVLISIFKKELK